MMGDARSAEGTYLVTAVYEHSGRTVYGEVEVQAPNEDIAVHDAAEEVNWPPGAEIQVEEVQSS